MVLSPRRDNSKGNIIALFSTYRVYQFRWTNINGMSLNISYIFNLIWIGIPKPHLQCFRLAASTFSLFEKTNMLCVESVCVFVEN